MQLDDRPTRTKDRRLSARLSELDPSRFPASIAVAGSVPIPLDEEFAFGLELIVSGLSSLVKK
jgi:TetR/AcrR family tetracycline transcriptional repressor